MKRFFSILLILGAGAGLGCASRSAATFASPDEAVRRLVKAGHDEAAADQLLGSGGFELLKSGDEIADRQDLDAVAKLIEERVAFEDIGPGRKIALLGADRWEFPIPLVQEGNRWAFDIEAGREEILNRRVGRNELSTISTLRAIAEAQREYAAEGHDGAPPAFATKLVSTKGKRDGLFWPTHDSEPPSPLGPLVAAAFDEGYRVKGDSLDKDSARPTNDGPVPYHGYCYRLLTAQGAAAPGGAKSYLDAQGRLTRGFAVVAWPATYDNSGVMTFVVNQQGIVFQKNLGSGTAKAAAALTTYDPDASWAPVID